MRPHVFVTWLALSLSASAVRVPITRYKQSRDHARLSRRSTFYTTTSTSDDSDEMSMTNVDDLLYIANVTIAGTVYPVQLDTGSSDLWVKASTSPIPGTTTTTLTYNLTYGTGWADGNVSYATVEFAGHNVSDQAFMDVTSSDNPALAYGAQGIIGLGFDSLSTIDALVNKSGGDTGRTFLYNAFALNKTELNFISFALQDDDDSYDTVEGFFSIGEYDPNYTDVENSNKIATWPEDYPSRWTVLLDALLIGSSSGSTTVSLSTTVSGAPSNTAVVVLDSGTSYTYIPTEIADIIYGKLSGAYYDSSEGTWVVPCSTEVDVALQFGEDVYPINPLDLSVTSSGDSSLCLGTLINDTVSVGDGEFDWLIGDNVLRSVYAVYDFGDYDSSGARGNPYIRLLSLVDPDTASADFHDVRGGTALNITYTAANVSENSSSDSSTTVTLSTELAESLTKVANYLPAILAILALNALILIALVVAGIVYFLRKRRRSMARRRTPGRSSPMPMNTISTYGLMAGDSHAYQPVSMALTDDTFIPPSPAFSKPGFEGDTLKLRSGASAAVERPKSVA